MKNFFLIMSNFCVLLLIVTTFSVYGSSAYSQEVRINLELQSALLKDAIDAIKMQTEFEFAYEADIENLLLNNVSIKAENETIENVLTEILKGKDIHFKVVDKIILLSKNKAKITADNLNSYLQQSTVTGIITDSITGETLVGVNIVVKGTYTGSSSDIEGRYYIEVPGHDAILIFSYIGYISREVLVDGRSMIDIKMTPDVKIMEEVIVIGYGTQKKEDVSGSITTVSSDDFNKGIINTPEQLLNGKISGVQVMTSNGEPGSAVSIRIRGTNSISGSSEPLFVIDGVPIDNNRPSMNLNSTSDNGLNNSSMNPLIMLSPDDIKSMTILKDASATAIYGSRGANGVILITTKRGTAGQVKLSYSGYFGVSQVSKTLDILSANEYRNAVTDKELTTTFGDANTDWQDEIFRTALSESHNVAFSGGNQNTQYRVSLGTQMQEGIIISSAMNRYNARVNVSQQMLNDRLKFQFNLSNSNYNSDNLAEQQTSGFRGGVLNNVLKMDPTQPVLNADGFYNEYSVTARNPVALANQITDKTDGNRILGNLETEFKIVNGLFAKLNMAYDNDNQERKIFQPIASSIGNDVNGRVVRNKALYENKLLEFYLTYDKLFKKHYINVMGGYSWQEYNNNNLYVLAEGFSSDILGYDNIDGATGTQIVSVSHSINRLISFFGRFNYTYDNRYILTGTVRRDGSSRFGDDNKWGMFPSAAFAWRLNNESWMESIDILSDLKFRLSYGITGNQEIGNDQFRSTLGINQLGGAWFGGTYYPRYQATTIPNPGLQWEQTAQVNIGLDFGILNQRIYGSIDYYSKNTTDLLVRIPSIQPAVAGEYLDNIGELTNKGIELSLGSVVINKNDLRWDIDFNISKNSNEITKLYSDAEIFTGAISGAGAPGRGIQIIKEGESLGTFWGLKYLGLDSNGDEIFEDLNNDDIYDDQDMQVIGHALPTLNLGLSSILKYKDFDLSVGLRAGFGNELYNNTRAEISQTNRLPGLNVSAEGAEGIAFAAYNYTSSRWIEDASFLRLDNLTLGYNLKVKKLGTPFNARLYVTGQNLFVITDYTGYDPEVNTSAGNTAANSIGIDYTNYPKARTFLFGLNINF